MNFRALIAAHLLVSMAACANNPKSQLNRALPSDYQGGVMKIAVLPKSLYEVNGSSMPCDQLTAIIRIRRPSALILDSIGTIADAFCIGSIASELQIPAGTLDASGKLHEIRVVN